MEIQRLKHYHIVVLHMLHDIGVYMNHRLHDS